MKELTDEEIAEAARYYFFDDLAKFYVNLKDAPYIARRMFELGARWAEKKVKTGGEQ